MANNFDDFNYDGDDPDLDENGLPAEDGSSLDDLMDYIRQFQNEDE